MPARPDAPQDASRSDASPLDGPRSERRVRAPAIAPELTSAERAASLSRLGAPAPPGEPLDAARLDAARDRLRAAAAPPPEPPATPTRVDPGQFDAAQQRLRAARRGGKPA